MNPQSVAGERTLMARPTSLLIVLGVCAAVFGAACATIKYDAPPPGGASWVTDSETGIGFLLIPGGEFTMGLSEGSFNEQPPHKVRIRSFLMARTEVTVAQFAKFVQDPGYRTTPKRTGRRGCGTARTG